MIQIIHIGFALRDTRPAGHAEAIVSPGNARPIVEAGLHKYRLECRLVSVAGMRVGRLTLTLTDDAFGADLGIRKILPASDQL